MVQNLISTKKDFDSTSEENRDTPSKNRLSSMAMGSTQIAVSVSISLFDNSVTEGKPITFTMTLTSLESDSDPGTTNYIFLTYVVDANDRTADDCEGDGTSVFQTMNLVDENREACTCTNLCRCQAGDYLEHALNSIQDPYSSPLKEYTSIRIGTTKPNAGT